MEYIEFTNKWQAFFKSHGLCTFKDFFESFEGTQINKNTRRNVACRTIIDNGQEYTFFLKRFFRPHIKDMVFALYNRRRPCTQGRLEWNCANYLLKNNIGTYHPVCFGHNITLGIERFSFFLSEKLSGMCLMEFLKQHWHAMDLKQQKQMLDDLAAFVRKIHSLRISLPDLYVYHLYVEHGIDSSYSFSVIDLHRMSIHVPRWRMPACRVENLARLNFSLRSDYLSEQQRDYLLQECLNYLPESQMAKTIEKIHKRSKAIATRRIPPVY